MNLDKLKFEPKANLKAMLQCTMTYSEDEKAEINKLLSDNYFTIQL